MELFVGGGDNQMIPSFQDRCLLCKTTNITDDAVKSKCADYAKLFGILDLIWSAVRGTDAGLLPTNQQLDNLDKAIADGKELWIRMGLTTLQPKWHLTFDGHLSAQVRRFGGLADKAEDPIEKFHQTLKNLRDRFRGIRSYQQKENCIRRELRRRRSPAIQQEIDSYKARIKIKSTTKRKVDASERQADKKAAKKNQARGICSATTDVAILHPSKTLVVCYLCTATLVVEFSKKC